MDEERYGQPIIFNENGKTVWRANQSPLFGANDPAWRRETGPMRIDRQIDALVGINGRPDSEDNEAPFGGNDHIY